MKPPISDVIDGTPSSHAPKYNNVAILGVISSIFIIMN